MFFIAEPWGTVYESLFRDSCVQLKLMTNKPSIEHIAKSFPTYANHTSASVFSSPGLD